MLAPSRFQRSEGVKDVVHVEVKKYSGYFNPECKRFAVDPHVTTFADLKKIVKGAFSLVEPFRISYLCRDDNGESIYLAMLNEWDLDAAFMTSSDPYLWLKVDAVPYEDQADEPICEHGSNSYKSDIVPGVSGFYMPRTWLFSVGDAINKIASGFADNFTVSEEEDSGFFPNKPPLGDVEFRQFLDAVGRLASPDDLRLRIYHGGIEPSLRKVVWRMLLNIFPEHFTGQERMAYIKAKTKTYYSLLAEWQEHANEEYVQRLSKMIWKDVQRTDRTHRYFSGENNPHLTSLHNILLTFALTHKDIRYCQGMSDIASPILVVMDSEPQGYICFCGAMVRLQSNFSNCGKVMSKKFEHLAILVKYHDAEYFDFLKSLGADNMYFCYRWLLLEMKREFNFDDALTVMEVMWSSLPPQPPEIELCLGTLDLVESSKSSTKKHESFSDFSHCDEKINVSRNARSFPTVSAINPAGDSTWQQDFSIDDTVTISDDCQSRYPQDSGLWFGNIGGNDQAEIRYSLLPTHDAPGKSDPDGTPNSDKAAFALPSPDEFGCGNPFLLFICLSVLIDQKGELMQCGVEYDDLVMHFDRLVRKHPVRRILSRAMRLFASYLGSQTSSSKLEDKIIT